MGMDKDKEKLMALGSVGNRANIPAYKASRWFYGSTKLNRLELRNLLSALSDAENRVLKLKSRVEKELKELN